MWDLLLSRAIKVWLKVVAENIGRSKSRLHAYWGLSGHDLLKWVPKYTVID